MVQAGVPSQPIPERLTRVGGEGKQTDGKKLIKLFCVEGADPANIQKNGSFFSVMRAGMLGECAMSITGRDPAARGRAQYTHSKTIGAA